MKKPSKPKLLKGKKLTKALDDKIREIFKAKYGENPICFVCGHMDSWWNPKTAPRGIQVGHYIARGRTVLRWHTDNVFPQCSSCNIVHNTNPAPFTMAIIKKCGVERIDTLKLIAELAVGERVTDTQKRLWLVELEDILNLLKVDKPCVMV
jgi:hypothetical protein